MTANGRVPWLDGRAAVDLGTARIRLAGPGRRTIVDEPSAVPGCPRPIRHGLVADAAACSRLVSRVLGGAPGDVLPDHGPGALPAGALPAGAMSDGAMSDGAMSDGAMSDGAMSDCAMSDCALPGGVMSGGGGGVFRLVVVGVPVSASPAERATVTGIVARAAGCPVTAVEEPLAAALGSGLDVTDPRPRLLVDVGAGIVEAVVISDAAITDAVAVQLPDGGHGVLPGHVQDRITDLAAELLRRLPARSRPAARERGLTLTGGGAAHAGLAGRLCSRLGLTVSLATDPAHATVRGLARLCLPPMAALAAPPTA
ncbi:rod shape-determining protein [Nonomuraea sp. CA-218870]|uniref:rod shape-determining protein n=1 Tax=Nonomuraea sp. CA-218870 TaxID=3239998 RepID=UPI003D94F27F